MDEIKSKKEAKDRKIIQLIQSRCVHRRREIIKVAKLFYGHNILYCQDCLKVLYGQAV